MEKARALFEEMRAEMAPLEGRIREHPYVQAIEEGRIPRDRLRLFAGEQYHIITSDLRSVSLLFTRYGGSPSQEFFWGTLQGERAARDALLDFAGALHLGREDLEAYEPLPGAHAYTAYMAWLALFGSAAEVAAAFAVNFSAWGANCARLSAALKTRYGLQPPHVAFFDLFASPPPDLEEGALRVVEEGLSQGVKARRIKRAARLLQGYELMFWDTLEETSSR